MDNKTNPTQITNSTTPQSNITYSGEVTIKVMQGKKEISRLSGHNAGKIDLFKGICYYLAGYADNSYIPAYIKASTATTSDDSEPTDFDALNAPAAITGRRAEKSDGKWQSIYTAIITYSNLINPGSTANPNPITYLALYSNDKITQLATIKLADMGEGSWDGNIIQGSSVIVEWRLSIDNKEVTSN